jgi:hypothetical protein
MNKKTETSAAGAEKETTSTKADAKTDTKADVKADAKTDAATKAQ